MHPNYEQRIINITSHLFHKIDFTSNMRLLGHTSQQKPTSFNLPHSSNIH